MVPIKEIRTIMSLILMNKNIPFRGNAQQFRMMCYSLLGLYRTFLTCSSNYSVGLTHIKEIAAFLQSVTYLQITKKRMKFE